MQATIPVPAQGSAEERALFERLQARLPHLFGRVFKVTGSTRFEKCGIKLKNVKLNGKTLDLTGFLAVWGAGRAGWGGLRNLPGSAVLTRLD